MTDDLPFGEPLTPQTAWATPRCKRHNWGQNVLPGDPLDLIRCRRCHHVQDAARVRAGRSARRLGGDQERRIERVYGPMKVGERGDAVDHIGTICKWQSKATRTAPPGWISGPIARMDGLYGDRLPVLILSFVRPGVPVEDYVLMRGSDWLALHGRDEPQ